MSLVRGDRQGLWRSDGGDTRGVHALVVGISEYPHLRDGTAPAAESGGMGQLVVSAATAAQIFEWLVLRGRMAGRPIASCRLLLAPSQATLHGGGTEQARVDRITDGWYGEPTFRALAEAVVDWADEFYRTPIGESDTNAAFLFFSGHGLQVQGRPSLLAKDILNPASGSGRNNAVAYRPLLDALPTYGLGDGLFIFDSCRNGPEVAQRLNIVGREVLEPSERQPASPNSMKWLAATDAEGRAYQDPQSPRHATLFGQAVLEALEGVEPDHRPYDCTPRPWRLMFEGLESYTRGRVIELLRAQSASKTQTVTAGGEAKTLSILVAEKEPEAAAPAAQQDDEGAALAALASLSGVARTLTIVPAASGRLTL